jgi:S1-C subfamily serine protease
MSEHRIPTPRRSHRRIIAASIAATALGLTGIGYAVQADQSTTTTTATQQPSRMWRPGNETYQQPTQTPDQGQVQGQTQSQIQGQTQDPGNTDATAAQEAGLVYINTSLDYGAGQAAGTGMILTSDGEILTNHHVVEGATSISVQVVSTGKTYDADVVGYDSTHDVAVLQLKNASGLTTVKTDTSGDVQVGDAVTGVGNANGDGGAASAAAGKVAALDQSITVQSEQGGQASNLSGLIEVSADIIAGDSGGALYDSDGQVIGMNTAASSGSTVVTGYAVPITEALSVAEQIESGQQTGTVQIGATGFLGVQMAQAAYGGSDGAMVAGIVAGSPAQSAGITAGSTITAFHGSQITSAEELSNAVGALKPGQSVSVSWTDASGSDHTATVTLATGPIA